MEPKRKFAPPWNPLHSKTSFSANTTPFFVWFRDKKAKSDFFKKFSRRGIHSKDQVILSNFSDIDLPTVIYSRGQGPQCDAPVTCPSVLIQEFYSKMHGFDYSVPNFITSVWGTCIVVTPQIVADVLHVPRVEFLTPLVVSIWGQCLKMSSFLPSVSVHPIEVNASSLTIWALQKALGFWTWSWLLFYTISLTITLSRSLMLRFCFLLLRVLP